LSAKISEKATEIVKANSSLTFAEAMKQASLAVVAENRDLYNESKQPVKNYQLRRNIYGKFRNDRRQR
jgi:hypothetical protein